MFFRSFSNVRNTAGSGVQGITLQAVYLDVRRPPQIHTDREFEKHRVGFEQSLLRSRYYLSSRYLTGLLGSDVRVAHL